MDGTPFLHHRGAVINGEPYNVLSDDGAKQAAGARSWHRETVDAQAIGQPQQFEVPLRDFANGSGFTFEGVPGTYDWADDWDASTPEVLTTWGRRASAASFDAGADVKGWAFQLNGYVYAVRGRWVMKYAINNSQDASWSIIERHDLGSGNVCPGRPAPFNGKWYVPVRSGTTGSLQKFHELTTQVTTSVEVQTIIISGTPTSGTYTITFDGKTSAAIAYNAGQAAVQAALRAIPGLEAVTVVTTGSAPNYTHTVTMTGAGGALGTNSPPQMTSTDGTSGGTHAIAHATTSAGTTDTWTQGPAGREMKCFRVWKSQLRAGDASGKIYSVASDPMVSGDWTPAAGSGYLVGDPGTEINDLVGMPTLLGVGKPEGFYTFDENLDVQNHTEDLGQYRDANNFVGMEMAFGQVLAPHVKGLMQLWPGAGYQFVGPDQEGRTDQGLSHGAGRVAGIAPGGRQTFVAINDPYHQTGAVVSLVPPSSQRSPLIPHAHHDVSGRVEHVGILGDQSQPIKPRAFGTISDDNAVGTLSWSNPSNAGAEDGDVAQASNTSGGSADTHYLKLLNPGNTIPSTAAIVGVLVRVKRRVS